MIAPDLDTAKSQLQDLIHKAGTIVPFTGAGISTECGIPDFRSRSRAQIIRGRSGDDRPAVDAEHPVRQACRPLPALA
jgi:hypothetical protein